MAINYMQLKNEYRMARKGAQMPIGVIIIGILTLWMVIGLIGCTVASESINNKQAILAIIGEAENQDWEGMYAVACAIRNRGTLKGVYGIYALRVINHKYSKFTYALAELAWHNSEYRKDDITNGATHWENINAFGKPYWVKDMVETFRYKDHVFYKVKG